MLKNIFLALIFFISLNITYAKEAQNPFEDMFKDVNWDEVASEMEKIFAEMEQEEKLKEADSTKSERKESKEDLSQTADNTKKQATETIDISKKSDVELFLNPLTEKAPEVKGEKKVMRPWIKQACLDATKRIYKKFDGHLQSLEKKIIASHTIGKDYQDEFMSYAGHLGLFRASVGTITHKTLYQRIILAPEDPKNTAKLNEDMKSYRKITIDNLKELEKLDAKIKAPTEEEELNQDVKAAQKLKEYGQQASSSQEEDDEEKEEAITEFKTGKRGKKQKKASKKNQNKTPETKVIDQEAAPAQIPVQIPDFGQEPAPDFGPFKIK